MKRRRYRIMAIALMMLALFVAQPLAHAQAAGTGTYDDNSPLISYTGNWVFWNTSAYANAMFGTIHSTPDPNASASFTFTGSTITLFYTAAYNRGTVRVSISNTTPPLSVTFSANATEVRRQVAKTWSVPNGSHTITVRPNDSNSIIDIDIDAFVVNITPNSTKKVYDDYDPAIISPTSRYFGSWSDNLTTTGAWQSSLHWTSTPGDLVRFTFTGDQIKYIFSRGPNRGKALITIDGVPKDTIDLYSSDATYPRQYVQYFRGLGGGIHVITITNSANKNSASSGYRIDLDGLETNNCPGDIGSCRAYSRMYVESVNGFTSVSADITVNYPTIRDSSQNGAFSSNVIWIGKIRHSGWSYIEIGQRKEIGWNGSYPYNYSMYYINGGGRIVYWDETVGINVPSYNYRIEAEHSGSSYIWRTYIDGTEKWNTSANIRGINLGISGGNIRIGGEVTDASFTLHNNMEGYYDNFIYYKDFLNNQPIHGWDLVRSDYAYQFNGTHPWNFRAYGY